MKLFIVDISEVCVDANLYFFIILLLPLFVFEPFTSAMFTFILNIRISFPVEHVLAYFDINNTTEIG